MDLSIHKYGKNERRKFGKINEVIDIPDLVEIQKESYNTFIREGISEVFEDYSPITDYSDHFELYFLDHSFAEKPKYDEKECRSHDATYALPLRVRVQLVNKLTNNIKESDVYIGDFPCMTENGSFIINGAERVIVSQLVRSPGSYNNSTKDKSGKTLYGTTVIPNRGAWLEFEQDVSGVLWVRVDRKRKICATVLLRALGYGSDVALRELFGEDAEKRTSADSMIEATIERDPFKSEFEALVELYKKLRSGDVPQGDSVKQQLRNTFFDTKHYDVIKVGRYKFNKKLNIAYRLPGCVLAEDLFHPETGELLFEKGHKVAGEEEAHRIQNAGINELYVFVNDEEKGTVAHKIMGNGTVDWSSISQKSHKSFGLLPTVHYKNFMFTREIAAELAYKTPEEVAEEHVEEINRLYYTVEKPETEDEKPEDKKNRIKRVATRLKFVKACGLFHEILQREGDEVTDAERKAIRPVAEKLDHKHITIEDIVAAVSSNIDLRYGIGTIDNIDHLGNRRVRSVGELLQNYLRIGVSRLEKLVTDRMQTVSDQKEVTPSDLINVRPVNAVIKEFFGSSQLSQFMDQTNPIAELTHKRKLSSLGPGGLTRDRATFEVRDVHYTHYGRMCPIETPEGQNIGLISSLSTFSRVNEFGFIMTPYRRVRNGVVTDEVDYLTADEEDKYIVAQANEPLTEDGHHFVNHRVGCRRREDITELPPDKIDYMDVSPKQLVSVATALIPFLENDDTHRALMGSNMQRQAVPLLKTEAAMVATGVEGAIASASGVIVKAKAAGVAVGVSSDLIRIKEDATGQIREYPLKKFERSNQGTCLNQRPIIHTGDRVEQGEIIADGPSTDNGELALGKNIMIGFMEWEGYNYEDAVLISEEFVQDDIFTSVHIEELQVEARETKLGPEEITRDIPNAGDDAVKDLDAEGIIRIGAEVHPGDYLVGKVSPKGDSNPTPEDRLLKAIFGDKAKEVKDTSLKVPHGEGGVVVDVKVFTKENKDELAAGVIKQVKVYIAQKRKIQVGDKIAGRHGNKGVISRILPKADMPFTADGTPLQIVLNPLGVPSRMNIGQVLEVHLGYACKLLGWKVATPVFDSATEEQIRQLLRDNNGGVNQDGEVDGKVQLYDGRTGEKFENRTTVGIMYMIKLIHLVDDKIHARSTGPYALVTQQPLGGKAQFGGQRFGEMEVWALEAYGAAHVLQEILTVKSDDVVGRTKTYESIVRGSNTSEPGIPEAFKVLLMEMRALALDVSVLTESGEELKIGEMDEADILSDTKKFDDSAEGGEIDFGKMSEAEDDIADDDLSEDIGEVIFDHKDEGFEGDSFAEDESVDSDFASLLGETDEEPDLIFEDDEESENADEADAEDEDEEEDGFDDLGDLVDEDEE